MSFWIHYINSYFIQSIFGEFYENGSNFEIGYTTDENGNTYTPDMVMGEPRKGLKVTYVTDSRPTDTITENAADSDLFICEGMYGDPQNIDKAKEKKHMIYSEAAQMARDAGVGELWLTHYSPSMNDPREYLHVARDIFPDTVAAKDGRTKELKYEEAD